jgi:hypothetical protein
MEHYSKTFASSTAERDAANERSFAEDPSKIPPGPIPAAIPKSSVIAGGGRTRAG